MIFVTVGTHEQQFNRLVKHIDELKGLGSIEDDVIIQTGYCTYEPKYCKWRKLLSYREMIKHVKDARLVITHGGPSSFIMPLQIGKIPIVVPRQKQFDEHVNDHQIEFVELVFERNGNIIPIYDINQLGDTLNNYDSIKYSLKSEVLSNNDNFNRGLSKLINDLIK
ncbi:MAG: glycosyltransferase [Bacteroidales bacterium]